MDDEAIEETLAQFRDVNLYQIPPRPRAGGHKSGTLVKRSACEGIPPPKPSTPHQQLEQGIKVPVGWYTFKDAHFRL
jgi:hypothetical protein